MSIIDSSELEDFAVILEKKGLSKDDFEVTEIETSEGIMHKKTGVVTVKNKESGIEKEYKAGYQSHWVTDFEEDLEKKAFFS